MSERERLKRNAIAMCSILALLVAVLGLTYAYFVATAVGNDNASSVIVKTAEMKLIFTDGLEIKAENVLPGWKTTKTFTVKNTGTAQTKYDIKFVDVFNSFVPLNGLTYKITGLNCSNCSKSEITAPSSDSTLISGIIIEPGVTQTFNLDLMFKEASVSQDNNQNKQFLAKINVIGAK